MDTLILETDFTSAFIQIVPGTVADDAVISLCRVSTSFNDYLVYREIILFLWRMLRMLIVMNTIIILIHFDDAVQQRALPCSCVIRIARVQPRDRERWRHSWIDKPQLGHSSWRLASATDRGGGAALLPYTPSGGSGSNLLTTAEREKWTPCQMQKRRSCTDFNRPHHLIHLVKFDWTPDKTHYAFPLLHNDVLVSLSSQVGCDGVSWHPHKSHVPFENVTSNVTSCRRWK